MIKRIYANGCSWTAGNGIHEDDAYTPGTCFATYAYPSILAELLGCQVTNEAQGAGSNDRLVRMTCEYLRNIHPDEYSTLLVVIGWTSSERQELYLNNHWMPFNAMQQFSTHQHTVFPLEKTHANEIDKYQKQYITHVYSEYANISKYINQKYMLANLLENLGVKYIFTDSLPSMYGMPNDQLSRGLDQISRPQMLVTPRFDTFCHINKFTLSTCIHPKIDAHRAWANYLLNIIKDLYKDCT